MGLCSDAPDYPKAQMDEQLRISKEMGSRYLDLSEQQQTWAETQWTEQQALLKDVLGTQTGIMEETHAMAQEDRARYEEKYQPIEDDLIRDFMDFDTTERRDLESGRAQAGVQQSFDAQRRNAEQRLSSYGIDPSQLRGGALDLNVRLEAAKQQAAQGNAARNRVEDLGRSLRAEAINIGKGYPSQVAASYGQALAAGDASVGNMNRTTLTGANTMGTGGSWGGMASNQVNSSMSGINNMYSGQLAGYEAGGAGMAALGGLTGQVLGGWASSGFSEGGGAIPGDLSNEPGPNDTVPVVLAVGEYVIPEDVVRRLGTNKLDSMITKERENTEQEGVEAGDMPREDATSVPGGPDGAMAVPVQGYEGGGPVYGYEGGGVVYPAGYGSQGVGLAQTLSQYGKQVGGTQALPAGG
jgi:hypothetical protein